jgi:hypothetical protein
MCLDRTDLIPNKKYLVTFKDCCIQGEFIATFIK